MVFLTWTGLLLSLLVLLLISRRNLYLALFCAAMVLGLFALPLREVGRAFLAVLRDPEIVLLALAVAIIPLIGGGLEQSGLMESLVRNMRIGRRAFLASSPALLGMLPMPGGALLSAPLVERGSHQSSGALKAAVNVWFRHILYLVYPLGPALIASAKVAQVEVYRVIPYLFPFLILSLVLGYYFLLRNVDGRMDYTDHFSLRGLLVPLLIILAAPAADLLLKMGLPLPVSELGTLIGVSLSLLLVAMVGRLGWRRLGQIGGEMRVWRFALIIVGMFFFLNVFQQSSAPELIAGLELPKALLCVAIGFLLGVVTGRIQSPASIIIPIFLVGSGSMGPLAFALTFYAIFLGYVLTPIHPCISASTEYFNISLRDFLKVMAPPAFLALSVTAVLAVLVC